MPAEDQNREEANLQSTNGNHSFDELAKGLANGSFSRGQALRWIGAALLGGVLASIPGVALAHHRPDHTGGSGSGPPSEIPPTGSQGCPAPKIRKRGQCVCPTDPTCRTPKVQNPTTCECECSSNQEECFGLCCSTDEVCASGICCPSDNYCATFDQCCASDDVCTPLGGCCPSENACFGFCCASDEVCAPLGGCCPSDNYCSLSLECCASEERCTAGGCCSSGNVCGIECCEPGQRCEPGGCV